MNIIDIAALVKWLRSIPTLHEGAGKWVPCPDPARQFKDAADALERQHAVVKAAQLYTKLYDEAMTTPSGEIWQRAMDAVNALRREVKALAALGAPPTGDG